MNNKPENLAQGPLNGIRVLDFSMFLAGPYCTRLMADMGAEIIKVEPPNGDLLRQAAPFRNNKSAYFGQINCGKKSLKLDLKKSKHIELVKRLVAKVDVVLENFRPGVMERLDLDYAILSAIRPNLIYCSISGYGQTGPGSKLPAFAPIIHAASGYDLIMMEYQGIKGRPPTTRSTVADVLGATHAFGAINAALVQLLRTGKGQYIDVAMMDAMHNLLGYEYQAVQTGNPGRPAIFSPIRTSDGFVMVAPVSPANFAALAQAAGRSELIDDVRFRNSKTRIENWDLLLGEIERWSSLHSTDICEREIQKAGCPCTRYLSLGESLNQAQITARGAAVKIADVNDSYMVANCPARFQGSNVGAKPWVPQLGQHNEEFFEEVGLSMAFK